MSLKPHGQLEGINLCFPKFETSERGGILSMVSISGLDVVQYVKDPSGTRPLGIQLNDVENLNFSREYYPRLRRTDQSLGIVGVGTQGDFETDWLHLIGVIKPGTLAYVGPSGTITDDASLGGPRIGKFLSTLKSDPHTLVYEGLGFSTSFMDPFTKKIVIENNPLDRVFVITPGFAKIRIDQATMMRSS